MRAAAFSRIFSQIFQESLLSVPSQLVEKSAHIDAGPAILTLFEKMPNENKLEQMIQLAGAFSGPRGYRLIFSLRSLFTTKVVHPYYYMIFT
jgi:hypothetical protein